MPCGVFPCLYKGRAVLALFEGVKCLCYSGCFVLGNGYQRKFLARKWP
jgi:hypothetical protein